MFHSRKSHTDTKRTTQKFLDPKKETQGRLKALRSLLDIFGPSDSKVFFQGHYSEIFYVFNDVFCQVETNLKQKGHRSQREDLDSVLYILEQILLLLPELIHKRWQFNSIGRIMLKLLHHGNALKLRREGVRLFMLWYQALTVNSDELTQLIYASIIPGFPSAIDTIDWSKSVLSRTEADEVVQAVRSPDNDDHSYHGSVSSFYVSDKDNEDWCSQEEIFPIYPMAGSEKAPPFETLTKFFLDRVLDCMSSQMVLVEWAEPRSRDHAFAFLFNSFKKYYLPYIFPQWNPSPALYHSSPELQVPMATMNPENVSTHMVGARESVLRWFVAFTVRFKRQEEGQEPSSPTFTSKSMESLPPSTTTPGMGSTADMMKSISNDKKKEDLHTASDIIRRVLYSTKENVQLLHEVLRQGFRLPPRNLNTIRQVLSVYQEWIKHTEKPIFMQEQVHGVTLSSDAVDSKSDLAVPESVEPPQSPVRTWSYCRAFSFNREPVFVLPSEEVRAGLQANLRLFILHSAEVFLAPEDSRDLEKQVDVCKRVIHLYRSIVLEVQMEQATWEQLLVVLLEACRHLLSGNAPTDKMHSLSGQLAASILQTLFVTWIRANLKVPISLSLWDKCLDVLSSLTHWEEVIAEWNTTLQTLTRVLARTVYNLDLDDLPLDRLSEQKRKRRRHQVQDKPNFDKLAFSRWSRMESRGTGSPKMIRSSLEVKSEGMSSAPVTPNIKRPSAQRMSLGAPQQQPVITGPPGDLHVVAQTERSAFQVAGAAQMLQDTPLKTRNQLPSTTAGTVTTEETAGQSLVPEHSTITRSDSQLLNRDHTDADTLSQGDSSLETSASGAKSQSARELYSRGISESLSSTDFEEDLESLASTNLRSRDDSESISSADRRSRGENESEDVSTYSKPEFDSSPPHFHPSPDSAHLRREDTSKSAEWFNMSFEPETGSNYTASDLYQGLSRISESSLETKFDEASKGSTSAAECMSTPTYDEVLGEGGEEAEEYSALNPESRFSPAIGNQEFSEDLPPSYRSPSPSLAETREEMLDLDGDHAVGEEISVLAGGIREGWGPVAAVALWRRMLGILGNVNQIKSPSIHAKVIECLISTWNMLAKVRMNQGISLDNKFTPAVPDLLPPLQYYATWVFEAASLLMPHKFKSGRLLAYQLICTMTVRQHDTALSQEYLTHFYRLMHIGLTGTDQDVISVIIRNCSKFFSMMLPCSTLLILDFIQAANTIFINQNLELPRAEAVTLMGSLLCYPNAFPNMPLHQPGHQTNEYQPTSTGKDIKEKLIVALLRAAKLDPSVTARCIALNSLGVFLVEELVHCKGHPRVHDCICVLLQSTTFHHKTVSTLAIDLLHMLSQYTQELCAFDSELPIKVVEVMCHTVTSLLPGGEFASVQEENSILVSVILCLLDWVMVIPSAKLMARKGEENRSTLSRVFQVLQMAAHNRTVPKRRKSLNISTIISGDGRPVRLARVQETSKTPNHVPSPAEPTETIEEKNNENDSDNDDQQDAGPKAPVSFIFPPKPEPIKLTAKAALMHIVNHLGHFPLGAGPSRLDSLISEHEDHLSTDCDEMQPTIFNSPNIQFFVLNDSVLVSAVELPKEDPKCHPLLQDMTTAKTQVRLITRDMTGRFSWDHTMMYSRSGTPEPERHAFPLPGLLLDQEREAKESPEESRRTMRGALSTFKSTTPIAPDRLDEALSYIGSSSRECVLFPDQALNEPAPAPVGHSMESSVMEHVLTQHTAEHSYIRDNTTDASLCSVEFRPPAYVDPSSPFQLGRFLISETGLLAWEKRLRVDLLKKNEKFLRELKNLDNRRCRETHKIAVLYVAAGQEDKTSIMSNSAGSQAYEDFVAALGWEVDLSTHTGFLGGLERNLSTGETAPYYATSMHEVMFHVATRMPLATDGTGFNKKMRHLGNDEVHIVWSEHSREYRYGIVNTEFGDVLLIIYPLKNHMFRIHIIKKPEVPSFGPLFDGAIVNRRVLPSLVRATAINASMAKRSLLPLYERYYEERDKCIERIVQYHKQPSTFEEFASRVFSPAPNTLSRPSTPLGTAAEAMTIMRTQTLSQDDSSLRMRSKSTGTGLIMSHENDIGNEELATSLPDELDKVSNHSTDGGATLRQDKRRLSLRWRNKPSPTPEATTTDANNPASGEE
ncbi:ral GTPase-activating protein subunit alpha-2 [Nematostella vectensis]|uniref:ral GTPase-activating protein subunit alpha-2 n=1 Tax=Nematostella vectensis TaxID=45351 RepID=UPI00207777CE|nr:ral GTPase-activating protein subunit alpha-2 [Nematostella vectensis]